MKKLIVLVAATVMSLAFTANAATSVQNVKVQQRYPWNGLVDIDYKIVSDKPAETDFYVYFTAKDHDMNRSLAPRTVTGDGVAGAPIKKGQHRATWDMGMDAPGFHSSALSVSVHASTAIPYLVVELSAGAGASSYPVRYSAAPPNLDNDTCRTTELWLKFIQPGTFMMGSPSDESSRGSSEPLHTVTLTSPYYIGVFEVTQRQWELVMGAGQNPAYYKGDTRPVERVSYNTIRGTVNGASWPTNGQVDETSFIGKLRAKTNTAFDLPTEAQWEYACRAGTSTAFSNGLGAPYDTAMATLGRHYNNQSDGKGGYTSNHTKVGSYLPNMWGLYDMHGNVWEWCLDWYGTYATGAQTDPVGSASGSLRLLRGGGWNYGSSDARSACRGRNTPSDNSDYNGFRLVALPAVR